MALKKYEEGKKTEEVVEVEEPNQEIVVEEPIVNTSLEQKLVDEVNIKRSEYKKYADKQKKINYAITAVVAVCLIGTFMAMMFIKDQQWIVYAGVGFMAVILIATYLSSKLMRKNLMQNADIYIDYLYKKTSSYIYNDRKIEKIEITPKGKFEDKYFIDAHFYKDIKSTKSRNFSHFNINGVEYDVADLAANTLVKGRLSPKFLGRFYSIKADLKTSGKVTLFQLKGGNLSVELDNIDDLKLVEGNEKYAIYTNDENYKKVFTQKVLNALLKFKIQNPLIDVIFSIKDNLISLGIDYDDSFLNIPVEKEFTIRETRRTKEDFEKVLAVIDALLTTHNGIKSKSESK